jgi:hypothetical protein
VKRRGPDKKRSKAQLRRELDFIDRQVGTETYTRTMDVRRAELIRILYGEPTKAELATYRKQWIRWKRTMKRLREAGVVFEIDQETGEPIFEKSI